MPRKPISFELDFMIKDIFPRFAVKQFDDVSFNIKPKNQGLDYDITGTTGKIFVGVNNDMFMQTDGITVSSNNINVLLDKNMLQKNGRAYAEIELTDSAGTITSSSFIFDIDPKIGEGGMIPGEYEGFVEKYERLISEFKSQVNSCVNNANTLVNKTINNCNTNVDNKLNSVDSLVNVKISDFEKRFNRLTSSQQQDAEVIDARVDFKGVAFDSLKERIDCTDKLLRDSTVSTVTTESDFTTVEATSNGYFEDVKLEGKTLVSPTIHPINDIEGKKLFHLTNLKQNTIYTMINPTTISLSVYKYNSWIDSIAGGYFNGNFIFNTLDNEMATVYFTGNVAPKGVFVVEGDHTQNPPNYFEGLKSVGQSASEDGADEIVVSSVNENLFDGELQRGYWYNAEIKPSDNAVANVNNTHILQNTQYYISVENYSDMVYIAELDESLNEINSFTINNGSGFITSTTGTYLRMCTSTAVNVPLTTKIQIVRSTTPKPYTPHQSDKKRLLYYNEETQTWEKPILRQWDSIEKHADGKYYYHQRSGEVVLNGSETIEWFYPLGDNTKAFYTNSGLASNCSKTEALSTTKISDKFKTVSHHDMVNTMDDECLSINDDGRITIRILKSKLSTQDVQGFKQWLQANPVTVVYQLAQEKVYECTNIDLITYANETNYVIESGAIVPKTTLKVHNNISNVVSLLQKKVSLLESNITSYMITQNRLMLASRYNADTVSFKVDVATLRNSFEYDNDLYELILNNILVGKDNYNRDYIENLIIFYWMDFVISDEMYSTLFEIIEEQHNPKIIEEETPLI